MKVRRRVKNAARPRFLSRQDVTDPKVCEVSLSFSLLRLVNYFLYHLRSYSQQTINKARYDAICVYEGAFTRQSKNGTDPTKTGTVPIVFAKKQ